MKFSERHDLSKQYECYQIRTGSKCTPVSVITFLDNSGYLRREPNKKDEPVLKLNETVSGGEQ